MPDLERELRALAPAVDFPATPDLASELRRDLPDRPRSVVPRRIALVVALALLALVAGLAIPPARSAILDFFGVGSVRIELVDRLPQVEPATPLELGAAIDPEDAPFPLLRSELLGDPDGVYVSGRVVTLLYGTRERVRLLVTEVPDSGLTSAVGKKLAAAGTSVEFVSIRGATEPGIWITGRPHVVELPGGPPRLVGNTLVWVRDSLTLRTEGAASLEQAVEIAESLG